MSTSQSFLRQADAIATELHRLSDAYAPTPLLELPALARKLGVAHLHAKDEGQRMLGSFKSLGGTYAGLRALSRACGLDISDMLASRPDDLPALVCASDGNHGLAVALAARLAGAPARVFLHATVPESRSRRIAAEGAGIVMVQGTYDDAVDAAAAAAREGAGILIADTTDDPADPVVGDVMAGYGVMAAEIRRQFEASGAPRPTHLFVQAGVGGLAAAMAEGLAGWMAPPSAIIVVEPGEAACIAEALAAGHAIRLSGALETVAGMLSCGEASAPALEVLLRHGARAEPVSEAILAEAPVLLRNSGGPATTASGGAGLAGLMAMVARGAGPGAAASVLILVTEGIAGEES
jgi:diaminopropionate ammonia-lyase